MDIAVLHWKKRRLHIGTQLAYRGHPDADAMAQAGENGWEGVGRYLHETSGNPGRVSDDARAASKKYLKAISVVSEAIEKEMSEWPKGNASQDSRKLVNDLTNLAKEVNAFSPIVVHGLKFAEDYDLHQGPFERAHRPDVMERYSKVEANLDKQIDKAFARLVRLKEYAKMYPEVPMINPPAAELAPPLSPAITPESSEKAQQSE